MELLRKNPKIRIAATPHGKLTLSLNWSMVAVVVINSTLTPARNTIDDA
jgi:hypothetical protein